MFCTHCGSPLDPAHSFCTTCGTPRPGVSETTFCTTCGTPYGPSNIFCTKCGSAREMGGGEGYVFGGGASVPLGSAWALRPLGVAERLDAAIKAYFANFRQTVTVLTLIAVPFGVIQAIITYSSGQFSTDSLTTTAPNGTVVVNDQNTWTRLAGTLSNQVILSVVSTIAITTVALIVGAWYVGSPVGWREALRRSARRLPSTLAFLFLRLLTGVALAAVVAVPTVLFAAAHIVVGAVLVGVFGSIGAFVAYVWLDIKWKATVPSIILEDLRVISAMRRSFQLIRGCWWSVFGTLFLAALLVGIISGFFSVGVLIVVVLNVHNTVVIVVLLAVLSSSSIILLTPFTATVNVIIAIDMRVRKEGLDLELLSQQIDVPTAQATVPAVLRLGSGFPSLPPVDQNPDSPSTHPPS